MLFSTRIRFQEVHARLGALLFQNEPQRTITIMRQQEQQFVLLPMRLYDALLKVFWSFDHTYSFKVDWIGITEFRKGMLSFERACALFGQKESPSVEALVILRHNRQVGVMFLAPRYEALLDFLASRGTSGLEVFTCDAGQPDHTARTLPIAAAVQCLTDLPAQLAHEQESTGVTLPVLVSKNNQVALALFSWELGRSVMQELASREVSAPLEPLVAWWRTAYAPADKTPASAGEGVQRDTSPWILCIRGDGFYLVEHFPYRESDRVSIETRSVEREAMSYAALLVTFALYDGGFSEEQRAFLGTLLPTVLIFDMSTSLQAFSHVTSGESLEEK